MARRPVIARFDIPAVVERQMNAPLTGGRARGEWTEVFRTRVRFVPLQGGEQTQAGLALDRMYADVTFRQGRQAAEVSAGDRIRMRGTDYAIDAIIPADRLYPFIRARVSIRLGG